jgi:hypothetical protein
MVDRSPMLGLMFTRKALLSRWHRVASGEVQEYGQIGNTPTAWDRLLRKPRALGCWI